MSGNTLLTENRPERQREQAPTTVHWRSWPLIESPVQSVMVLAIGFGCAIVVHLMTGRFLLGILTWIAATVCCWPIYIPTFFEVNAEGVHRWIAGFHQFLPWHAIEYVRETAHGLLVFRTSNPRVVDFISAIHLPCNRDLRQQLARWPKLIPQQ